MKKYFTLTELMLAISFLGIIALIATPQITVLKDTIQVDNSVKKVKLDIEDARRMAYEESKEFEVKFYKEGYQISSTDSLYTSKFYLFPMQIEYINDSLQDNSIIYTKDGSPLIADSLLLKRTDIQKQYKLEIKPAIGSVEIIWIE